MSTHGYNPVILINVFTRTQSTQLHSRGLSTPLPQGAILLAININQKLVTINAKSMGTIQTAALLWYLTMSQLGHNPRGCNPVVLINVSTRTQSTWLPVKCNTTTTGSDLVSFSQIKKALSSTCLAEQG